MRIEYIIKLNDKRYFMESIIHPISGETGFFVSTKEKNVIDAILSDFRMNQLVVTESSRSARGVDYE